MDKRLKIIIIKCQKLRDKHGLDYEEKCKEEISIFSKYIIKFNLIDNCDDKDFAKQLCISNALSYSSYQKGGITN